jgi:hypothetical protein
MFFDIRRAFDIVWHAGFSHKLQKIGIRGPLLKWFKSYLSALDFFGLKLTSHLVDHSYIFSVSV